MSGLEVLLLGTFHTTLNGETVTRFRADSARALLAYLALHARTPCRRETLTGLLWPDLPETEARHNLRQTLNRLRTAIGDREANPPVLLVTRKAVQFNLACDHWLDIHAFDGHITACTAHRHRRLDACRACIRRLREAVDLYRGDLLAGFTFPSAPFEGWLVTERERLHLRALDALHHLATYHERRGEYELVEGYARRQVALEPWREGAHRQWMRALALSGQRGAALAQYAACRRAVREELGVEPEAETTALYARIRDGGALEALSRVPPHNLPAPLTPFVGREAEMAALEERLGDPDCRLLTLVGPGGMGKTRLAQEAAAAQVDAFPDGVYWVPLAALQSAEALLPSVARALGFSFYGAAAGKAGPEPRQQVLDYLRHKSALLVLDNVEHLLAEHLDRAQGDGKRVTDLAVDILRAAPDVTLLITSRERLNVRGEHLFPVGGMEVPVTQGGSDPQPACERERYSSVQLFVRSARRVRPGYEPAADDWAQIVRICRLVGGMPLGILLAASWMQMLSPADIAAQIAARIGAPIGESPDFLAADLRDVPERQRSIRSVFDHSWNLLTGREQSLFVSLSVFRGGFTGQAAQAVAGASLRDLLGLANKSLLHRASTPLAEFPSEPDPANTPAAGGAGRPGARYGLHELLRQYAAERLAQSAGDREATCERHRAYYCAVVRQWARDFKGARQQAALAEMDAEIENVRAAWDEVAERGQVERLDQAIEGLCLFYEWRGRYREGETACRLAAERVESNTSGDGLRVRARILTWQGAFSRELGRRQVATQLLLESGRLLDSPALAGLDTRPERAFLLLRMGYLAADSDRERANRLCECSLALYRALDDRWGTANALSASGTAADNLGAYEVARQLHTESLVLGRALGDRRGIADSLWELGAADQRQGKLAEAERLLEESIAIRREIGDRAGMAAGLHEHAMTLYSLGRLERARTVLQEGLAIYEDMGVRHMAAHSYTMLGSIELGLGQTERARAYGQAGLASSREVGFRRGVELALLVLSSVAWVSGAFAAARERAQESAAVNREIGHRHDLGMALALLGGAARELGDLDCAERCLCEALQIAAETGAFFPAILALPVAALLLADRGEVERAVEVYALASRHPFVARSRWFEDVAGQQISAAAAALPPAAVIAARERGRARDLDATVKELLAEYQEPCPAPDTR